MSGKFNVAQLSLKLKPMLALPIVPELARIKGIKFLCLSGEEEKESHCRTLPRDDALFKAVSLGGGHHFGGDDATLTRLNCDCVSKP